LALNNLNLGAMIEEYKTEGFVFRKENKMEADRIFSVFTKDFGRIEIFAKAIRKINSKLRSGIEIFSLSEIEFVQGKMRKTLIDAVSKEKFKNTKNSPEKLEIAYRISDFLNYFLKGQEKDDNILNLIIDTFERLNNIGNGKQELGYFYFAWNLIFTLGYAPQLSECSVCKGKLKPENIYFSNREGGIVCNNCYSLKKDGVAIKPDVVKILRLFLEKKWDTISKLKIEKNILKSVEGVSENYFNYILENNSFKKIHD